MKIFAVILAVCFVGALAELTVEQVTKLYEYRTACITETGVDEAKIETATIGDWKIDDIKLRCFFSCMLKKLKFVNEDETLNEEIIGKKIAKKLPPDIIDSFITKCRDLRGADMCETAILMLKCYAEEKASLRL